MARVVTFDLDVPASATQGVPQNVDDYEKMGIYITGTFVATIQLQVSGDGVTFHNEGSPLTAPGKVEITIPCLEVRADVTAFTSGAPAGKIAGLV